MKVFIRADASASTGMGHIVRCSALAHMLKEHFEPVFVCRELPENTARELAASGFSIVKINEDQELLNLDLEDNIVVLDGYHFTAELRQQILAKPCKLASIHDFEEPEPYADLIINHAPGLDPGKFKAKHGADFALGLKFALLRPKFLNAAKQARNITKIETVFIGFGGSDYLNYTGKALQTAADNSNLKKIIVVTGTLFPFNELLKEQSLKDTRIELHHSITENRILELMQQSDLAIVPSSGMLFEALAAGCLAVSGYFVDNQIIVYERFLKEGLIIGAGSFSEPEIRRALEEAFRTVPVSRQVIDGLSKNRLLGRFLNLAVKIRPVETADCDLLFNWVNREEVRQSAVSPGLISYEDHVKWFHSRLNSSTTIIYIMEFGGNHIGQVRYDLDNDKWLISFYIDEPFRGLGLGKTILKKTMFLQNKKHFIAFVKEDNLASNKTFISLNFKLILIKKIKERIFSEYHYELND